VGCADEGGVVVPALPGAAFVVVQTETGFDFAVVVFDAPAQFRQPIRMRFAVVAGSFDSQYLTGSGSPAGHSAISHASGRSWPTLADRMAGPAGRTR
jgi:hypothetical protein